MKKSKFSQRLDSFVAGKGFYIALFLCVAVIGVTSWAILFTGNDDVDTVNTDVMYSTPDISSSGNSSSDEDSKTPEKNSSSDSNETANTSGNSSESSESSTEPPSDTNTSAEPPATAEADDPAVNEGDTTTPVSAEDAIYVWPVVGEVLTAHSLDTLVYNITMADWRTHDGVDIAAEKGATVLAISGGTVESVYDDDLYGTTVVIDHGNGLKSVYSNLAALPTVAAGDSVTVGEVIGSVGSTAIGEINEQSHIHLSATLNGESVDPLTYLPAQP